MQTQESTTPSPTGKLIQIEESRVRVHLAELVRGSVEDTLNAMLQKEADELCQARRYERNQGRGHPLRDERRAALDRNASRNEDRGIVLAPQRNTALQFALALRGVAKRTRGGRPLRALKSEGIT